MYVFGISRFTKNHQNKIRWSEDRLTQTLVFPKPKPKPFKKYYDEKCSRSTFAIPKTKTITQIRLDDQNKGERKAQIQK